MADIPAARLMYRYFEMEIDRPPAPAAQAWRGRLAERAPYAAHVMRPFGELLGRLAYRHNFDSRKSHRVRDDAPDPRACSGFANQLNDSIRRSFTINLS